MPRVTPPCERKTLHNTFQLVLGNPTSGYWHRTSQFTLPASMFMNAVAVLIVPMSSPMQSFCHAADFFGDDVQMV